MNADQLTRTFSELEIYISETASGAFVVFTEAEPLFCFERGSIEECQAVVSDTLTSYVRSFFHSDAEVHVELGPAPVATPAPSLPVEELRPVSRVLTTLGTGRAYA